MDVLIRYGFSIEEIKNIMDTNILISNIEDNDIYALIDLLGSVGCMNSQIRNIFICNPFYLSRSVNNIEELINTLKEYGFTELNYLFDSNPYILNINASDIIKLYNDKKSIGMSDEEIRDFINYNVLF
jgi:hypothetical protein